ncbi:MAG: hypothetical protein Q8J78_12930 [Moraxellaceae bacterium]|nr:hypothetical protein [Moraxellaceae bacterium]
MADSFQTRHGAVFFSDLHLYEYGLMFYEPGVAPDQGARFTPCSSAIKALLNRLLKAAHPGLFSKRLKLHAPRAYSTGIQPGFTRASKEHAHQYRRPRPQE